MSVIINNERLVDLLKEKADCIKINCATGKARIRIKEDHSRRNGEIDRDEIRKLELLCECSSGPLHQATAEYGDLMVRLSMISGALTNTRSPILSIRPIGSAQEYKKINQKKKKGERRCQR